MVTEEQTNIGTEEQGNRGTEIKGPKRAKEEIQNNTKKELNKFQAKKFKGFPNFGDPLNFDIMHSQALSPRMNKWILV